MNKPWVTRDVQLRQILSSFHKHNYFKKLSEKKSTAPVITVSEMLVDCWPSSSSMLVFSGRSRGGPPLFLDQTEA